MEIVSCVNANQVLPVKNVIPEIRAHQILATWEFVHQWVNNFNVHVCHHSKDQHVLIKILANLIHVKTVVNVWLWVILINAAVKQALWDVIVTKLIYVV